MRRKKEGILSDLVRQESPRNVVEDWNIDYRLEVEFLKYSTVKDEVVVSTSCENLNLTIKLYWLYC